MKGQNKTLKDFDIKELNNSIISNIENIYPAELDQQTVYKVLRKTQ